MADNDADVDVDIQDDFEKQAPSKPSLKEAWESNPIMKIAALALGAVVIIGAYTTFIGGEEEQEKSIVRTADLSKVKAIPGQEETDPEYQRAVEEENRQRIEEAKKTGQSVMPTLTGPSAQSGLSLPEIQQPGQTDPLADWRRQAEARRAALEKKVTEDEETAPQAEIVPLVTPVRPQQQQNADPEAAKRLGAQMRTIITAQKPEVSQVVEVTAVQSEWAKMKEAEEKARAEYEERRRSGVSDASSQADKIAAAKVIVPAGSVLYGQLMNELNSDIPGPVLVQLASGPFSGGRALGTLSVVEEWLTLSFNKVIKDGVVYDVDGIALDEQTTLTGLQTDIDHHYFSRVILPAAAEFIKGYAAAAAETGTTTTTTNGGGVVQDDPEPDTEQELLSGLEEGADAVSTILEENSDRPITIKVARGTTMGILFLESVTTANAQ